MVLTFIAALAAAPAGAQQAEATRPEHDSVGASLEVVESYPGLLQRATVLPETAVQAALRKVKKGHLDGIGIEDRGKRLVYVIRVEEPKGRPHEVLVDANTGRVLSNRKLPHPH